MYFLEIKQSSLPLEALPVHNYDDRVSEPSNFLSPIMNRLFARLFVCFICMTIAYVSPLPQLGWAQTWNLQQAQVIKAQQLIQQGEQEFQNQQPEKAFDTFQRALNLARREGDRYAEGKALHNIAFMYDFFGQPQKALEIYHKTVPIRREIDHHKGEGITLFNIGIVYFKLGQTEKGMDYINQAASIFQENGFSHADFLGNGLFPVDSATATMFAETLSQVQQEENLLEESIRLREQGIQKIQEGRYQEALETYQHLLTLALKIKDKETEAAALRGLSINYKSLQKYQKALDYYRKLLSLDRELGDQKGVVNDLNDIGGIYNSLGEDEKAIERLQEALRIAQKVKYQDGELNALLSLGLSHKSLFQHDQALDYLKQALPILEKENDLTRQISTLNFISAVYKQMGKPQDAIPYLDQSLLINQKINDSLGMATVLHAQGSIYDDMAQREKALELLKKALSIQQKNNDRKGIGETLNTMGVVYQNRGEYEKALEKLQEALSIRREFKDSLGEAVTLTNLCSLKRDMGQLQKETPKKCEHDILGILDDLNDKPKIGVAFNTIGKIYDSMGRYQEALDFYNKALKISNEVSNPRMQAITLNNIGSVYEVIGQTQCALIYFDSARKLYDKVDDGNGKATVLNNRAVAYISEKKFKKAEENLSEAWEIYKELKDHSGEVVALTNIGYVYDKMKNTPRALESYNMALDIARNIDFSLGEAHVLSGMGGVYRTLQNWQEASDCLNQALSIHQRIGDRIGKAATLTQLGYLHLNQPTKAIDFWEQSVNIGLETRKGFQRRHRRAFLQSDIPRLGAIPLIDLLIKQDQPDKAFEWANLVTTFELANYARLNNVLVDNREAQQALNEIAEEERKIELLEAQRIKNFSEDLSQRIVKRQEELNLKREATINRFPEVAEELESKPADITQLRQNIPQNTVVIQPVLLIGNPNVPNSVAIFVLSTDNLTVIQRPLPDKFDELLSQYHQQVGDHRKGHHETGRKLYDIFIRPVEERFPIPSGYQIAIIATGLLRNIPFEPLYDSQADKYLLQKYPVYYLTHLSRIEKEKASSAVIKVKPSQVQQVQDERTSPTALVFANPKPTHKSLRGTELEANYLIQNFPGSKVYRHEEATLDNFKTYAYRFPILHLGTHGCFVSNGCPNMKPYTLLFANKRQYKITEAALLGLSDTELVVLSACETAKMPEVESTCQVTKMPEVEGVGLSGLAYIWERAGAKSIIASLWNAPDKESSDVMIQFYGNLKKGMSKAEAMRQAKLSLIKNNEHSFFWAPFILIGDAQSFIKHRFSQIGKLS